MIFQLLLTRRVKHVDSNNNNHNDNDRDDNDDNDGDGAINYFLTGLDMMTAIMMNIMTTLILIITMRALTSSQGWI